MNLLLSVLVLIAVAGCVRYLARLIKKTSEFEEILDEAIQAKSSASHVRFKPPAQLPIGAPAPFFVEKKRTLFIFFSDNCGPCEALVPEIERWGKALNVKVWRKNEGELAQWYRVGWTPAAVLISSNGRIASDSALGDVEIRLLAEHAMQHEKPWQREGIMLPVGTDIPCVNARGKTFGPGDLKKSLLLFWNPYGHYCDRLLEDLANWKRDERLTIISSGPQDDELEGISNALILYSNVKETEEAFGIHGSPAAVLTDENGRIASSIAVGVDDVRALIGLEDISREDAKHRVNREAVKEF